MKFLITGGSGFLGKNLAKYLLDREQNVICYDRSVCPVSNHFNNNFEMVVGDIRNKELMLNSCAGVDIVVHTAAGQPRLPADEILSIDIDGTRNVLEAASYHKVKRIIHISSASVYGFPDKNPVFEDTELKASSPYAIGKIKSEEVCQEFRKKGLIITIFRPKKFIGHESLGILNILFDWAKEGRAFPILGRGTNHYQLLDVDDLCEAICLAIQADENAANDTYNIGAKNFRTIREDYQSVLDYAGFGKKIKTTPERPIILALRILELLKISPLSKFLYETASRDYYLSTEKAEKLLGYRPKYSNGEILVRNFQWYLENKNTVKSKTLSSHKVSFKMLVLSVIKLFF